MNWSTIETGWSQYKANAKQQWSKLTEEQLANTQGKREHLASRVQEAYSLTKEDTERQVSDWQAKQPEFQKQEQKQAPAAKS